MAEEQDFLRPLVQAVLQELLEAEMTEALGAAQGERTPVRLGYRAGPNAASCLRLVRTLAVDMHENWLEAHRYLKMDDLREHDKEALRMAA